MGTLRFGRYVVERTLGAGAMGEVHAAVDEVLGREVAIKTIKHQGGGLAAQLLDERFKQEARAIASLSHPNIVALYDVGLDGDPPYLVMERVAGPSLKEQIAAGALAPDDARALGVQLARALAAAHARGILHRDVKPANVLAAGDGVWKLADFGVAHVPDSSLTITGQFVGSPAYAAPEALALGQFSPAADVYGLGATLYEALSGRCAFESTSITSLASLLSRPPPPPLSSVAPSVPTDLAAAVARAIDPEPSRRPSAEALAALIARGDGGAVSATATATVAIAAPTSAATTPWTRRALWIGAGLLAIGVVVAIATGGGSRPTSSTTSGASMLPAALAPSDPGAAPTSIEVPTPAAARTDGKAAKEWSKVVDKLREHAWGEALDRLDHWEDHFGASDETAALRSQVEAVRASDPDGDEPGPPGPRGHGHKH